MATRNGPFYSDLEAVPPPSLETPPPHHIAVLPPAKEQPYLGTAGTGQDVAAQEGSTARTKWWPWIVVVVVVLIVGAVIGGAVGGTRGKGGGNAQKGSSSTA
jgi:ABC-type dipeptide/oligopeptide/nickel transport system permease subunit